MILGVSGTISILYFSFYWGAAEAATIVVLLAKQFGGGRVTTAVFVDAAVTVCGGIDDWCGCCCGTEGVWGW